MGLTVKLTYTKQKINNILRTIFLLKMLIITKIFYAKSKNYESYC